MSLCAVFIIGANELQDVTAYGLRSDFLSPETMPKATVEIALAKNRKLLLACMLAPVIYLNESIFVTTTTANNPKITKAIIKGIQIALALYSVVVPIYLPQK